MKSSSKIIFGFLIAASLMVTGWTGIRQRVTPSNFVWEYKVVGTSDEGRLNESGSQGWELVTAYSVGENPGILIFKRRK